jgi:hypothetical protein
MTSRKPRRDFRGLAKQLILVCCAIFFSYLDAEAAECYEKNENEDAIVIAVYAELSGSSETKIKDFEQEILDRLQNRTESDLPIEFCTITKAIFPSLGTTNLFNSDAVRKMLSDKTKLANKETIADKLIKFKVRYLAFIKSEIADSPSRARFLVVRFDPLGGYSNKKDSIDGAAPISQRDEATMTTFFDKIAGAVTKLAQPPVPPKFPILIMCFEDKTPRGHLSSDWDMTVQVRRIPVELTQWLVQKKKYTQNQFPVRFEGTCPFKQMDHKTLMNTQFGGEEGFIWTGEFSLRGLKTLALEVRFLHVVNNTDIFGTGLWEDNYTTSPWTAPNDIAPRIAGQFEDYLRDIFANHRQGTALSPDILGGTPLPPRRP